MSQPAKRFVRELIVFLAPLALVPLLETTLFPIDAFTFRCWEALAFSSRPALFILGMPFYPGRRLEKTETGGLGHRTSLDEHQRVVWQTDEWGFRNGPDAGGKYDVVIVGDSFAVGTGLSQEDTLAAQLDRYADLRSYDYAPASLEAFLGEQRFRTDPRPIVVYELVERELSRSLISRRPPTPVRAEDGTGSVDAAPSPSFRFLTAAAVAADRYTKGALLLSFRQRLREAITGAVSRALGGDHENVTALGSVVGSDGETLFLFGPEENREVPAELVQRAVERLVELDQAFRQSGFEFVVLPVPNKENIYFDLLPGSRRPDLLDQVTDRARIEGVAVVDLQTPLRMAKESGVATYHRDDTHWNSMGANVAAQALGEYLLALPTTRR